MRAASDDNRTIEMRANDMSVSRNVTKSSGRKKLSLTPELQQQLPFVSVKTQCPYRFKSVSSLEYLKNNVLTLEQTMEHIGKNILLERKYFQNYVGNLQNQVVQLEENNYLKSVKIENLQLYNSEKLKIINSLTIALNETIWKRDTMQRICEEHSSINSYKSMSLVNCTLNKISVLKSNQANLQSYLMNLEENYPESFVDVVKQLKSDLDECIGVIENIISQELSNDNDFNETIKQFIYKMQNCQFDISQFDYNSAVDVIDLLKNTLDGEHDVENLTKLWEMVKNLFQINQCLSNKVNSLNMHKIGLKLQLDEMENNTKELELKTMTEMEEVEKKEEILNQNESLIQQHWNEMDTSQEMVAQTNRALEIDQELEDLQIEYYNHDNENRRLKTNLCHLKNELVEYQLKCEQLEKNNKQIEIEKTEVLDKIARSWGHYNAKQKIKYTERLIKDTDTIIQEIKSLELEYDKVKHNSSVRTPVFSKTQLKSEKLSRTFGVIDTKKPQKTSIFRENIVRRLRYS